MNNDILVPWLASQGPDLNWSTGKAKPTYAPMREIWAQIQPLPTQRLTHLMELNIQGVMRQVYMRGAVATAVRADGTGGDLLQFAEVPNGPPRTWLVVLVDEQWPTWCRVVAQMQNDQKNASIWSNPAYTAGGITTDAGSQITTDSENPIRTSN